jgi:hypothetical protein
MSFVGCIFMADVADDGALTSKWESPGEAYPLSLKLSEEVVKVMGRTCVTKGKVIGTKSKPADISGSLTLHEYKVKNVARALQAMVSARSVSSSTLTSEAVVLGKFGEFSDIGTEDLSSVVVKDATDTTTYVENTDYLLDSVLGLISPVSGGAIAEDATVHVSGDGAANSDNRLTIGAGTSQKVAIKGHLLDEFSGDTMKIYLRKVLLTSSNETNLASEDGTEHEQLEFELVPEIPTGQTDYGTLDGLSI